LGTTDDCGFAPFRYRTSADVYLEKAKQYAHVPLKQAVVSAAALSLLYPQGGLRGYSRRLRTFCQCANMFSQVDSEEEALQSICEILVDGGEFRLAWIGYCEDDAKKTIRPVAKAGSRPDFLERIENSWGNTETGAGPPGIAVRVGELYWTNDILSESAAPGWMTVARDAGYASLGMGTR
jgi:hypothetical protein